jgi:predicted nucleic-acid-binding protein
MIAADSNLVIRHLTEDAPRQTAAVRKLFDDAEVRSEPVWLGHIVLCEICWVLKAVYGFEKNEIAKALQALLDDAGFCIEARPAVEEALALYRQHAGQFPDHLIGVASRLAGATTTYTFDKAVGKLPNFTILNTNAQRA